MESLPPPPDTIPHNVTPLTVEPMKNLTTRLPLARRGLGTKGQKVTLLANHFKVGVSKTEGHFYHYSVAMSYEDGHPVEVKGIGRKVIDKLSETYGVLQSFAYDGEKSLFTVGSLPHNKQEFVVVLEEFSAKRVGRNGSPNSFDDGDSKRMKRQTRSKTIKVDINYAAKIPIQAIANALRGQDSEHFQEAVRVLDIILRQHAARQGCLLVRQSFFHDSPRNFTDIGGGVQGCRGFHSSFRATQGGLSLNVDVSTTMVVKPGPVIDFLCLNQNVQNPNLIDWLKAKRMLKNLRVKANNMEYKIIGLSEKPCRTQTFSLRHGKDANGEVQSSEITVYDYFKHNKKIELRYSADMPCINVGKPKRPSYFPVELCSLVSLQRYTKALTNLQRAQLVEKSRQKPQERKASLQDSLRTSKYGNEPMLHSSGITIEPNFIQVEARVLQAPRLTVGGGLIFCPRNGRWNFNDKKLVRPVTLERWAIVNFSARCDTQHLCNVIKTCAQRKGMNLRPPFRVFEEDRCNTREPPVVRVERLYEHVKANLPGPPQLLLCILPERKNSELYGPWKKKNLANEGVATQCIAPTRINDQYITNVLLKINAKLGGMNSFLTVEDARSIPLVSQKPTLILGMDVSHGSPGRSDVPSIAAVVSSRCWPEISRYRASVRTQSSKVEMISSLFKPVSDTEDDGIMRELIMDFHSSSGMKPQQIIIFRDGVSESQFNQVLNNELGEIIKACNHLDEKWDPKFTLIIAQKNHHTRFFHANNAPDNVQPGTVIDNNICHPKNNDFYMCAHAGAIGTSRPTHYHVLHDEIGFTADDLQELVHSLSYVYQRSTTAISVVAPICYAHLAAAQMGQFMKFDEFSETSSSHGSLTSAGPIPVPQLPRLHKAVANSMFFC
ncbi:protein argonaute 4-like [Lotus japonicus]|uniref:protein argonaute 4-like n=1 Tax=Lotus japonicus TaxID=34305 RepID=UPI0025831205|nr:protein argonaute 4-like [Lotus japonicus]XP_057422674.1 protein argonaute 4-like [Lotus japonicus]